MEAKWTSKSENQPGVVRRRVLRRGAMDCVGQKGGLADYVGQEGGLARLGVADGVGRIGVGDGVGIIGVGWEEGRVAEVGLSKKSG